MRSLLAPAAVLLLVVACSDEQPVIEQDDRATPLPAAPAPTAIIPTPTVTPTATPPPVPTRPPIPWPTKAPTATPAPSNAPYIRNWLYGMGMGVVRENLIGLMERAIEQDYDKEAARALRTVYESLTAQRAELSAELLRRVVEVVDGATWTTELMPGKPRVTRPSPPERDYYIVRGRLDDGWWDVDIRCLMQPIEGPRGPRAALLNARLKLEAFVSTDGYGEIYYYAGTAGQPAAIFTIYPVYGDDVTAGRDLHPILGVGTEHAAERVRVVDTLVKPEILHLPGQDHRHAVVNQSEKTIRRGGDDGA